MRTPPLVLLAASTLFGCTIGDSVGDDSGAVCGDGLTEGSETCDDSNTSSGDGCSSACQSESGGNPALTSSIDKETVSSELGQTVTLALTLTSIDGFTGPVQVTPTITAAGTPLAGLTVAGPTSIDVAAGASVPTQYQVVIPTNFTGNDIAAEIRFDLNAAVEVQDRASALSLAAVYTVAIAAGTGTDLAKHSSGAITVKRGAKIRFKNNDTVQHITHGGPVYPHETINAATGAPGATYEVLTQALAPSTNGRLGCHNHQADATYINFVLE